MGGRPHLARHGEPVLVGAPLRPRGSPRPFNIADMRYKNDDNFQSRKLSQPSVVFFDGKLFMLS